MKTCKNPKCSQINPQPLDKFYNDKGHKDGKMAICKACKTAKVYAWREKNPQIYNALAVSWRQKNPDKQHANEIKRHYGLSIEDYNALLVKQEMKCAICNKQHDPSLKRGRLYVDHDHVTGKVRALLCAAHNSMLGYAEDKVDILEKAIAYLKKHREE
jgi:hypothetical protein